jgi:hypothetical protein
MAKETAPTRIKLLADPVIEAYKRDVDRTLLRNNLRLTVEQRIRQHRMVAESAAQLRAAGRPKDFEAISELESLLEERESQMEDRHE